MPTLDVIDLYAKLRLAPDETERARLIAHAFAELEQRYPQLDEIVTTLCWPLLDMALAQ